MPSLLLDADPGPDSTLSILLVEDDPDTRMNLEDILQLDGHRVTVTGSFAEAKNASEKSGFHVVILDRRLPDGNADDRLPDLVRWLPQSEIIVVTGFAELDSTIAAFRYGVADYILKPINPDALRQSLGRIVKRRQIEHELKREQQFADLILQTAEAVVLVLNTRGQVVRYNPFLERLSGWPLSEARGKDWFSRFIPPDNREQIREVFMETLSGIRTSGTVNEILTRDGSTRQIRWSNTALREPSGRTTAVLAVGVDITDMLSAQQKLLQSERLAAIGQTMTALAHESRNALQRIQAGLEMLELELQGTKEAQKDLGSIRRATKDLHHVLEEVRSFAAPILLHIEETDIREVWRRAWRQLDPERNHPGAKLIEPNEPSAHRIAIDVMRVEQIFRNLFENSLAAGNDNIEITIGCDLKDSESNDAQETNAPEKNDREPSDPEKRSPRRLRIVVADNGPGLGNADTTKLFEPFYTTKPTGTGLGLSIVARIIEAHRGTIEAVHDAPERNGPKQPRQSESSVKLSNEDQVKTGAKFVILLPLDLPQSSAPR